MVKFKSKLILILPILTAVVILLSFVHSAAKAQENQGLDVTVSPPVIEINANPGETVANRFRIRNNQQNPVNLTIDVKKLAANDFNGEPVPADPAPGDDFISWVTVDQPEITAPPNEWVDVNFSIAIPENAAFGYYYVLQISQVLGEQEVSQPGAQIRGEILVVTLLNVKKDGATAKGELVEFKPSSFISEYLPVEFTARIANKGNIHIRPRGNVFIRSFGQNDVGILEINSTLGTVLPDGTRAFSTSWNDGFLVKEPVMDGEKAVLDSEGKPVTKLKINWNKLTEFRVGKYTATLLMVYDDGQRDATIEGTATFWLIPYTALTVIFISLVVLFFIIRFILRWYINKELKKRSKGSK